MKTQNRRYPRSSGMNGDKSGESGAFLFSRRFPDFCDGRRSFPTNENSNLYHRGRRRPSAMDFAHYQSPKYLGSSPPITFVFKFRFSPHFPFPAKFIIGKIWDRPVANIRYIGKIWDGRQKVKSPIVWDLSDI